MDYAILEWHEGQPYNPLYEDIYYSSKDGRSESEYVFLKQNDLPQSWQGVDRFVIAETGFGTGLNFVLTVQQWLNTTSDSACLHYVGIEKHPVSPADIRRMSQQWPDLCYLFDELLQDYPLPVRGQHIRRMFGGRIELQLVFMDVVEALDDRKLAVNAWYLDGFGPAKNPDLWSQEVFELIAQNCQHQTSLSTYTCAGHVRRGLENAGFDVSKVKGHGAKREMIRASFQAGNAVTDLTPWYQYPSVPEKIRQAVIVGAGLAGLSLAWTLVERGWRVTVVDRHQQVAGEASGNLAGLVMPRFTLGNPTDEAFYSSAFLHARHRLNQLNAITETPVWFESGIELGMTASKADKLIKRYDYNARYLYRSDSGAIDSMTADSIETVRLPAAGWALPGSVCDGLVKACGGSLVKITAEITSLRQAQAGWQLLDTNDDLVVSADAVILASGTGANLLEVTSCLPLSSVRGQVTTVPANEHSIKIKQAVSVDTYVTPAFNGLHVTGASYSLTETRPQLLERDHLENLQHLESFMPGVFSQPEVMSGRVGFRAVSADRVPLVGAVADYDSFQQQYQDLSHGRRPGSYSKGQYLPGLYMTAGHGSRGLCSCFLSAEIIASMLEAAPLPVDEKILEYISPARFYIRQLRRNR